ncbi:MAG: hypothetical protein ACKVQS_10640 [Fimbriimonadaceae bacterium]
MGNEIEVRIYNWVYVVGVVPPVFLIAVFAPYLFEQSGIYWLACLVVSFIGVALFGVALKGLLHFGPILVVSDRGLKICHPFCNLGWVQWKDILRLEINGRMLLVDFSKHFEGKKFLRFSRIGGGADVKVPLSLIRGLSEEELLEVLRNHLSSERF